MEAVPARARGYVAAVAVLALLCLLPLPAIQTPWWALALLSALYAACEYVVRRRFGGTFHPVLLAGAFLLPPPAAALVPVPAALLCPVEQRTALLRRVWRAAQPALAVWGAATVHWTLGGRDAVVGSDFPYALLPAGAAVLAFCLILTGLDGGILAVAERVPVRRAWRGLLSRTLAPVAVHGLAGLMMAVLWRSPYGPVAALLVLLPMYVSWWVFAQYHRQRAAHQATIRALVQAVDLKDGYTRGHSERVGQASVLIARELGMDDDRVEVLRFAGILHDVGKLGVPTRLLRKDGPLTPEERRIIELHPEYGHEMVRGISFLGEARTAILHHHERLDGSGYPYGLAGDRIPECARVVAVADAFDAMTSTRSYSRARPVETALAELERCAGAQFDPRMVGALGRALRRQGWHPTVTADEADAGNRADADGESAPGESAHGERGPGGQASGEPGYGKLVPGRQAPGERAPGEPGYGKLVPGRQAPVESAPGEPRPAAQAPGGQEPGERAPGEPGYGKLVPGRQAPVESAPGEPGYGDVPPGEQPHGGPGHDDPAYTAAPAQAHMTAPQEPVRPVPGTGTPR